MVAFGCAVFDVVFSFSSSTTGFFAGHSLSSVEMRGDIWFAFLGNELLKRGMIGTWVEMVAVVMVLHEAHAVLGHGEYTTGN